eukprot:6177338-Pleurochrysis_carterae.AAC.1
MPGAGPCSWPWPYAYVASRSTFGLAPPSTITYSHENIVCTFFDVRGMIIRGTAMSSIALTLEPPSAFA